MSRIIWIGPAIALLFALLPLPYGYYTLLRFVVCGASCWLAYKHYEAVGSHAWTVIFIVLAVLFNPIIPIHFPRNVWAVIDAVCALLLFGNMKFAGDILSVDNK